MICVIDYFTSTRTWHVLRMASMVRKTLFKSCRPQMTFLKGNFGNHSLSKLNQFVYFQLKEIWKMKLLIRNFTSEPP